MPRRNQPHKSPRRPGGSSGESRGGLFGDALAREESGPAGYDDERFMVRQIPGARATKTYRCPGCDQEVRPGVAHVVAWPADAGGADDRRHWHTGCWAGRRTRGLTRRWS
ncbi:MULTISPECIES: ATP/GTP-binding protein [Rhodococcus]|uniref:ATP/GTP-binding protein n=1 Tax=Rhodococcus parequi TaxID=3137122 RepID=A0ABW9FMP7_9NOCA